MSRKRRQNSRRPGSPTVRTGGTPAARSDLVRPAVATTSRDLPGAEVMGGEQQPPAGALYPQILRTPERSVPRSLGSLVIALAFWGILPTVIIQLVVLISYGVLDPFEDLPAYKSFFTQAVAFERPSGLLATNLAIAALVPITMFVIGFVHRVRPRWLSSVQPRLRPRYLLLAMLLALVVLGLAGVVPTALTAAGGLHPQPGFWAYLVIILLTSPLQAAGEEYFFRGYLMQSLGSLVANPWFGIVASSLVFAVAHLAFTPALFLDRLAFGLLAAVLVRLTGGLEAGIAAHVINNVFAFTLAGLTTGVAAARSVASISWATAGLDVGGFALFALLAWLLSRRMGLRTRVGDVAVSRGTSKATGLGGGRPVR